MKLCWPLVAVVILVLSYPAISAPVYTTLDVPFPGAVESGAAGITNSRVITGGYTLADGLVHGFVRDASGIHTSFDVPGVRTEPPFPGVNMGTVPGNINDAGAIVGYWNENGPIDGNEHSFLRDPSGVITTFDVAGSVGTQAFGINSSGDIAGYWWDGSGSIESFLRDSSGTITTFSVPGAFVTLASDIDDSGRIMGSWRTVAGPRVGFLRDPGGSYSYFDVALPGWYPWAVNNAGFVVGTWQDSPTTIHGFVRTPGGGLRTFDFPGALGTEVYGINDRGDIVGLYYDSEVIRHGFLLTGLVPEPSSLVLLGCGSVGLLGRWRSRRRLRPCGEEL
jgi:uncharacterized membrane protein